MEAPGTPFTRAACRVKDTVVALVPVRGAPCPLATVAVLLIVESSHTSAARLTMLGFALRLHVEKGMCVKRWRFAHLEVRMGSFASSGNIVRAATLLRKLGAALNGRAPGQNFDVLSNDAVLGGHPLMELSHPFLPMKIVL